MLLRKYATACFLLFSFLTFSTALFSQTRLLRTEDATFRGSLNADHSLHPELDLRYQFQGQTAGHLQLVHPRGPKLSKQFNGELLPVGPNLSSRTRLPDDPGLAEQWNMLQIDAPGAWAYTTGGPAPSGNDVVIAVIETNSFDLDHPELAGQIYTNPGEIPGNGIDDDGNSLIDDVHGWNFTKNKGTFDPGQGRQHGLQVSGILAAAGDNGLQVAGLNWNVKLLPLQVSNFAEWVAALDYVTALRERYNSSGGREGAFVVVASQSFGADNTSCSEYSELNPAFNRAGQAGILSVGATGNRGSDTDTAPDVPTSCASDFLVVVTAGDQDDQVLASSGFSPTQVDLLAPGATFRGLDYQISGINRNTFDGTSGATPHVSGVISLLYSLDCPDLEARAILQPAATALEMKRILLESVDRNSGIRDKLVSGGRLNARRAVERTLTHACGRNEWLVSYAGTAPPPQVYDLPGGKLLRVDTGQLLDKFNLALYRSTNPTYDAEAELRSAVKNGTIIRNGRLLHYPAPVRRQLPNQPSALDATALPAALDLVAEQEATTRTVPLALLGRGQDISGKKFAAGTPGAAVQLLLARAQSAAASKVQFRQAGYFTPTFADYFMSLAALSNRTAEQPPASILDLNRWQLEPPEKQSIGIMMSGVLDKLADSQQMLLAADNELNDFPAITHTQLLYTRTAGADTATLATSPAPEVKQRTETGLVALVANGTQTVALSGMTHALLRASACTSAGPDSSTAFLTKLLRTSMVYDQQAEELILNAKLAVDQAIAQCADYPNCELVGLRGNLSSGAVPVTVDFSTSSEAACPVRVVSAAGRLVYQRDFAATPAQASARRLQLDVSGWPSGVYYVQVGTDTEAQPFVRVSQ